MSCRATQEGQVMVQSSDKWWSTGEGNGKPFQHSCLMNPMSSIERQKDMALKEEPFCCTPPPHPQVGRCSICYWRRVPKNSRRNEEAEPKQKGYPAVDVSGGESKVQCCKEQYFIGNIGKSSLRSMNQGKLEVVNRRWQEGTSTF